MWLFKNKYKLMLLIALLYLAIDAYLHKGMVRVMLHKNFKQNQFAIYPNNKSTLINANKFWAKAINTPQALNNIDSTLPGCELDVYFDTTLNTFTIHHDANTNNNFTIDSFLNIYQQKLYKFSLWFDFKNLSSSNHKASLQKISSLQKKYLLQNKLLIESSQATLLNAFADSGCYTVYYTPYSLIYSNTASQNKLYIDSIYNQISGGKINALSGYYYQQPILKESFPNYPFLQWQANDKYSIINWLYNKKVEGNQHIAISLLP